MGRRSIIIIILIVYIMVSSSDVMSTTVIVMTMIVILIVIIITSFGILMRIGVNLMIVMIVYIHNLSAAASSHISRNTSG